jgi:hypothetical protein
MARETTGHTRRMKQLATLIALAVFATAAAAVALAGAGGADGASTRTATLRLADTTPVTVAGARFLARESVVVRATLNGERLTRRTRASAAGRFTTTFTGHDVNDRCNSDLRVTATGARGSEAVLKVGPQPQCPPRLRTP